MTIYGINNMRRGVEVENRYNWTKQTIGHMIENQAYCGDGVHNRFYSSRIKKKIQRENPKEEWIIVPNEHPAIITKAVFDQANAERVRRIEIKNNHKNPGMYSARELNFLKGKIFCADCGGVMYLERHNHLVRYICGNHHLKKNCFPHHIPDAKIKDEVLRVIHTHINVYTDNTAMIRRLNSKKSCTMKFDILGKEINRIQAEITKVGKHKVGLYEDYTELILDAEQYLAFKALDEKKERDLQLKLESILSEKKQYDINFKSDKEWDDLINSIRDKRLLTKKMVDALVKCVEVDGKGNIIVELVYDDMLQDLVKYARGREAIDEK